MRPSCLLAHAPSIRPSGLLAALFAATLLVGAVGCGGSDGDAWDKSSYKKLNLALQPLRKDFEDHYGQRRVVALVAPTCGSCIEHAGRIYDAVRPWAEENDGEIFIIWGSVSPTDTEIRCAERAQELTSPRIHHYFDDSGRTTRAFGRMLDLPSNGDAYDVFFAYGPEATWDPNNTMDKEPDDFSVALSLWEPSRPDIAALSGNLTRIVLPEFSAAEMIRLLDESAQ
ncbi:MAG: hypothetical protein KDA27_13535 [Candidatus Eisenbacteria bacterium]|uniref:Uncharacterized protein n=1 Tax=Eiseniibacteriota bacterium TaxID=2212470 RepID=A0A956NCQ0_UNCEI|nr:hypothetical protein [Candidatus Eisenbacteria bacterium]MCB9463388.1 hypothetical protein [Candidatus Eisenbacteria bacterium]